VAKRPATFTKVFRWQRAKLEDPEPTTVEVAGSFNGWEKMPLHYEKSTQAWQLTLADIPGNRTHNYMLFVDGQPAPDKNSDGLALPQTDEEKQNALTTVRGPRVFMLFSQTK
jgi:hypothetical protein